LPVVAISIAVLPLGWLAVRLLTRRLARSGVPQKQARRRALAEVGMVAGTVPWVWMILTPVPGERDFWLVPLRDLVNVIRHGDVAFAFFQIGGNLLVFAAFGFFAPIRWRVGPAVVGAIAALGSITVEAAQYVLALGRVSSVDDVLLNAAGAAIAAVISRRYFGTDAERNAYPTTATPPPDRVADRESNPKRTSTRST
jgi:hypothetical protein